MYGVQLNTFAVMVIDYPTQNLQESICSPIAPYFNCQFHNLRKKSRPVKTDWLKSRACVNDKVGS